MSDSTWAMQQGQDARLAQAERDLSAARQELRETAAAMVAMREAARRHWRATHHGTREEQELQLACLADALAADTPSLAAKIEAVVKAARAAEHEYFHPATGDGNMIGKMHALRHALAALSSSESPSS